MSGDRNEYWDKDRWETRWKMRWEERRRRREERWQRHGGDSHLWTGVFILLVGVCVLIRNTVEGLPVWLFTWPMLLIALGLFTGIKHRFRGGAWFLLILIGGAFLFHKIYPEVEMRQYILPGILILIGGFLILKPKKCSYRSPDGEQKKNVADPSPGIVDEPGEYTHQNSQDYKEDFVDSTSVFGGAKKNIISKNFKGGDLVSIFGGTELDLTRADFRGEAVLDLTTIFGGTKLIVPSDWTVKSEAVTIFGGLEDKRNVQSSANNPEKILILKGTVIFGGTEIKSF